MYNHLSQLHASATYLQPFHFPPTNVLPLQPQVNSKGFLYQYYIFLSQTLFFFLILVNEKMYNKIIVKVTTIQLEEIGWNVTVIAGNKHIIIHIFIKYISNQFFIIYFQYLQIAVIKYCYNSRSKQRSQLTLGHIHRTNPCYIAIQFSLFLFATCYVTCFLLSRLTSNIQNHPTLWIRLLYPKSTLPRSNYYIL